MQVNLPCFKLLLTCCTWYIPDSSETMDWTLRCLLLGILPWLVSGMSLSTSEDLKSASDGSTIKFTPPVTFGNSSEHEGHARVKRDAEIDEDGRIYKRRRHRITGVAVHFQYITDTLVKTLSLDFNNTILKHYELDKEGQFYPPWTYNGFYSPTNWHQVPIEYFTQHSSDKVPEFEMKRHFSAMKLCQPPPGTTDVDQQNNTLRITDDETLECYDAQINECQSVKPSPINILSELAQVDVQLTDFTFSGYDMHFAFQMVFPEDGTDMCIHAKECNHKLKHAKI